MQLTAATLGAFSKYPQCSTRADEDAGDVAQKKYGFFSSEMTLFETLANALGLTDRSKTAGKSWARHPLAFLTEAADDVCYRILDLEDGVTLNLVTFEQFREVVGAIADVSNKSLNKLADTHQKVGFLRAKAIGILRDAIEIAFLDNELSILNGSYQLSLVKDIPNAQDVKSMKDLAFEKCYRSEDVVQIEVAGFRVIRFLLNHLIRGQFESNRRVSLWMNDCPPANSSTLQKIQWATDYVSGMTDRFAVNLFGRLNGMALPDSSTGSK